MRSRWRDVARTSVSVGVRRKPRTFRGPPEGWRSAPFVTLTGGVTATQEPKVVNVVARPTHSRGSRKMAADLNGKNSEVLAFCEPRRVPRRGWRGSSEAFQRRAGSPRARPEKATASRAGTRSMSSAELAARVKWYRLLPGVGLGQRRLVQPQGRRGPLNLPAFSRASSTSLHRQRPAPTSKPNDGYVASPLS